MKGLIIFALMVAVTYPIAGLFRHFCEQPMGKLGAAIFFSLIATIVVNRNFGTKVPGSIFEKSEYSAKVWVNMFPDGSSAKNYRVKADVRAVVEDDGRYYQIDAAYFPDGGVVRFGDDRLEFGIRAQCTDISGRSWGVEFAQ